MPGKRKSARDVDESLARLAEAGGWAANCAFCAAGDPLILLSGT